MPSGAHGRIYAMKPLFTPDRIVKMAILGIGVALLLIAFLRSYQRRQPNVCPIDGQAAEWTKRNVTSCEYGHFSQMEEPLILGQHRARRFVSPKSSSPVLSLIRTSA